MQNTNQRLILSTNLILKKVGEGAVLLNLKTTQYYSLEPAGLHMLELLKGNPSIHQTFFRLLRDYAGKPDLLRSDFQELTDTLIKQEMVDVA